MDILQSFIISCIAGSIITIVLLFVFCFSIAKWRQYKERETLKNWEKRYGREKQKEALEKTIYKSCNYSCKMEEMLNPFIGMGNNVITHILIVCRPAPEPIVNWDIIGIFTENNIAFAKKQCTKKEDTIIKLPLNTVPIKPENEEVIYIKK